MKRYVEMYLILSIVLLLASCGGGGGGGGGAASPERIKSVSISKN